MIFLDPDPAKNFGPGRIRIHNTVNHITQFDSFSVQSEKTKTQRNDRRARRGRDQIQKGGGQRGETGGETGGEKGGEEGGETGGEKGGKQQQQQQG